MGRKSIPNWTRANFPTPTRFSRPLKRSCDSAGFWCGGSGCLERSAGTPNLEPRTVRASACCQFGVQRSMFGVRCFAFFSCVPRRVMGAWWPSRSSKPLSARSTSRGMFDSYPLRQLHLRFGNYDLQFEEAARAASPADQVVNRKSQIVFPPKGGGRHVARAGP